MSDSKSALEERVVYKAVIIDQMIGTDRNGQPQVVLTVKIVARLKNAKNPADGTEECPQLEREVFITIVEDDEDRLRMAIRDLERLGFGDNDISRLHPEHPQCISLVDKEVHLRVKIFNDLEYLNLAWPREKAKPIAVDEITKLAVPLKDKIAAAKRKTKDRSKTKDKTDPPNAPNVAY